MKKEGLVVVCFFFLVKDELYLQIKETKVLPAENLSANKYTLSKHHYVSQIKTNEENCEKIEYILVFLFLACYLHTHIT